MKYLVVDAFAEEIFGGNPAGVVLLPDGEDYPADERMIKTAAELRYSETAFIRQLGEKDFQVRYFTPVSEIELCGHATIGSFCALAHLGLVEDGSTVTAHTQAGDLPITVIGSSVLMDIMTEFKEELADPEAVRELYTVMGLSFEEAGAEEMLPAIVAAGPADIIMPVRSRADLAAIAPDMKALSVLSERYGVTGVHAFTLDAEEGVTVHARNFAPLYGIDEEAATGTSSGAMTRYLYHHGVLADTAECRYVQGEAMGRPSVIQAKVRMQDGALKIYIGGDAAVLAEGELYL